MPETPRLYGINHTNRSGSDLWGKNCFNATFPASLACLMWNRDISAVYLQADESTGTHLGEISIETLFGIEDPSQIFFEFESAYRPYDQYLYDTIERADLVIRKYSSTTGQAGEPIRPLEIKLTTIPDNSTVNRSEDEWSSEIVFRPATTMYCVLSIRHALGSNAELITDTLDPSCSAVNDWRNEVETRQCLPNILNALDELQSEVHGLQNPLIMQPIWKTEGKEPYLKQRSFDIFVWSDLAFLRIVIDQARSGLGRNPNKISRPMRSALRIARSLWELSTRRIDISNTFSSMTYRFQSDKAFALSGRATHPYLQHTRLILPQIEKTALKEIILGGGERELSPERRFDATVYFTAKSLFEESGS